MNSLRSSVLDVVTASVLAFVAGCGGDSPDQLLDQASEAARTGDAKKAQKFLQKCIETDPENVDAFVELASMSLERGDLDEAGKMLKSAEKYGASDLDVRQLGAQIAWHLKDYVRAAELYRGIANEMKFDSETRADAWAGLGLVEMTAGEPHLARIDFLKAIRINARNASARYHLALLYRDAPFGYNEAALEQMDVFVRLDPAASPRVQKTQRVIIPALKESIAQSHTERPGAATRNSGACAALLAKAEAEFKKGRFKQSRELYEQAFKADPLSYPAALGLSQAWLKTDATAAGRGRALDYLCQACSLRASAVSTFIAAGDLALRLGRNAQAAEIYSRAVAANPTSRQAIDGLIRAQQKCGQTKLAAAYQDYRNSLGNLRKRK